MDVCKFKLVQKQFRLNTERRWRGTLRGRKGRQVMNLVPVATAQASCPCYINVSPTLESVTSTPKVHSAWHIRKLSHE